MLLRYARQQLGARPALIYRCLLLRSRWAGIFCVLDRACVLTVVQLRASGCLAVHELLSLLQQAGPAAPPCWCLPSPLQLTGAHLCEPLLSLQIGA